MLVRAYARRPFQGVWATVLLAVDLRLEHTDVRHIAVLLGVIQPVALPTAQARREPFDLTLNGTE